VENITNFETGREVSNFGGNLLQRRETDLTPSRNAIRPHPSYRAFRRRFRNDPTAPTFIQFLRDDRGLLGLEVGNAIRLFEKLADHEDASVRANASRLLQAIRWQRREVFDQHPLLSEIGSRRKSPAIYIHDAIWSEIEKCIRAASDR
jgi:hypothetical protein